MTAQQLIQTTPDEKISLRWSASIPFNLPGRREQLTAQVHAGLHRIARRPMRNERIGYTLQGTALVHEAYLRVLMSRTSPGRIGRKFFSMAAQDFGLPW